VAGLIAEAEAFPAEFGLANTTDRACRGRLVESFTCLPADYVTPDANRTYLFADGVHFTGVVHEMQADLTLAALRAPGQVGQLALAGQLALQSAASAARPSEGLEAGRWSVFGRADWAGLDLDAGPWAAGLDGHLDGVTAGLAYGLRPGLTVGGALGWRDGEAEFGGDLGGFDPRAATVSVFARAEAGAFDLTLDATYGDLRFKDVTRRVKLGPATRLEMGDTHGRMWSAGAELGVTETVGRLVLRPLMGMRYERVEVGAYAEAGQRSSQITFGDQAAEQLRVSLGTEVTWRSDRRVQPFVRATYEADVLDKTRWLSITPQGAPVPFRTSVDSLDGEYVAYAVGARFDVRPSWRVAAEVTGTAGRGEGNAPTVRVGVQGRF